MFDSDHVAARHMGSIFDIIAVLKSIAKCLFS